MQLHVGGGADSVVAVDGEALLTAVGGEWQGALQWQDGAGNPYGDTPVTFALEYMGGEVSFVDRAPDGAEGERLACVDEVVIPTRFTLGTGDGLLQGAWDVEVRHEIGDERALSVQIEPFTGWDGEFSASPAAGSMWMHEELRLDAHFGEDFAGGTITLTGRNVEGDMIFLIVAQWNAMRK